MTTVQRAEQIAHHLDEIALSFLLDGRRVAAYKALGLSCEFRGEEKFADESIMEVAAAMATAEGGDEGRLS